MKEEYTGFHINAIDPSIFPEQPLQIRLTSLVLEIPTENRPHLQKDFQINKIIWQREQTLKQ